MPTQICDQKNYIGRSVPWEYALACGDVDPTTLSYQPVGSTNNKTWNIGTETSDNTADDTSGVTSSLVTYASLESTVSGFATVADNTLSNQAALYQYFLEQTLSSDTRKQPSIWVRVTFPDLTFYAFVNITSYNRSTASTDTVTFEMSVTSTATNNAAIAAIQSFPTPTA